MMIVSRTECATFSSMQSAWKDLIITSMWAFAIVVSMHASIPLQPVPMTLQATVICLIGLINTPKVACHAVFAYLLMGLIGIPVFSSGRVGLVAFTGPTAGYLVGFLVGVCFITHCSKRYRSFLAYFLICLGGLAIIIASGVSYLSMLIGMDKALKVGAIPFIVKDIISAVIAASTAKLFER